MCLLVESIRYERRRAANLGLHNDRMNRTRRLLLGRTDELDIAPHLVPTPDLDDSLYKCRVLYDAEIRGVEFQRYSRRTVRSLKLVECDGIDYSFKYADRSALEELFRRRGECDDILIVKNGLITDASSSNVVFCSPEGAFTPASYLLPGTKRQLLLNAGVIREADIRPADLASFEKAWLINAMIDPGECEIRVDNIFPF